MYALLAAADPVRAFLLVAPLDLTSYQSLWRAVRSLRKKPTPRSQITETATAASYGLNRMDSTGKSTIEESSPEDDEEEGLDNFANQM